MHIPEIRDDKVAALNRTIQWPGIDKLQVRATNSLQLTVHAERNVARRIAVVGELHLLRFYDLDTPTGSRDYLHALNQRVSPGVKDY